MGCGHLLRPRRHHRRGRRVLSVARPGRASERTTVSEHARVCGPLGPRCAPGCTDEARSAGDASGPDEQRCGDRCGRFRDAAFDHPGSSCKRSGGADEPPLPDARRIRKPGDGSVRAYLLQGGRIVDPAARRDEVADLLIRDGRIADETNTADAEVIDARGLVIAPGFVDMHTHVREPGRADEETIASASAAAAAGGYTAIVAMPNTDPVADTAAVVEKVWALGRETGLVDIVPAGALTRSLRGEKMADLGDMARSPASVRLFTDDGHGVQNALLARRAMEYLVAFDAIYAEHCEDAALAADGQMHEGLQSASLGLRGIPAAAEELMAARDIALARLTGCRLHLLHVSTAGTVELVRHAKAEGLEITAEATPHHFALTDASLES